MSTIVEKIAIPILILISIAILVYNPMQFELTLRLISGAAVTSLLMSLGFWLHQQNKSSLRIASSVSGVGHPAVVTSALPKVIGTSAPTIDTGTDIDSILREFKSQTVAQIDHRLQPHRSQRVIFSGVMHNVHPVKNNQLDVYIYTSGSRSLTRARFGQEWKEYLHLLEKGAKIKVIGEIDNIDSQDVNFKNCGVIPS